MASHSRIDAWRLETPGARDLIHLNNAGAALMPAPVTAAMHAHLDLEERVGGYEAADLAVSGIEATYESVGRIVGASAANIAIVGSATDAYVRSLSAFDFSPGDVIATSRADYTSYQIHYLALAQRTGVRVQHIPTFPDGSADPAGLRELLRRERCRCVHLSWIPTHSGMIQDAAGIGEVCEEFDVPFLLDACQAVGQLPIDVMSLRCDYLSATARKFLRGPRGIGFLYVSDRALARGDHPLHVDMRGARWVAGDRYELEPTARRFEDWEFAYALLLGLGAAAKYALAADIATSGRRARTLAAKVRELLAGVPGARVLDRGPELAAIVTASFDGRDARQIVQGLRARRINISATLRWYGLLDFDGSDVQTALRISPHYYNTEWELESFVEAVRDLVR